MGVRPPAIEARPRPWRLQCCYETGEFYCVLRLISAVSVAFRLDFELHSGLKQGTKAAATCPQLRGEEAGHEEVRRDEVDRD